jgi:hypothetical protein
LGILRDASGSVSSVWHLLVGHSEGADSFVWTNAGRNGQNQKSCGVRGRRVCPSSRRYLFHVFRTRKRTFFFFCFPFFLKKKLFSVRGDAAAVEEKLKSLSNLECLDLARSFACFGQLTNVVEDLERADALAGQLKQADVLSVAVNEISLEKKEQFFNDFFVSPGLNLFWLLIFVHLKHSVDCASDSGGEIDANEAPKSSVQRVARSSFASVRSGTASGTSGLGHFDVRNVVASQGKAGRSG